MFWSREWPGRYRLSIAVLSATLSRRLNQGWREKSRTGLCEADRVSRVLQSEPGCSVSGVTVLFLVQGPCLSTNRRRLPGGVRANSSRCLESFTAALRTPSSPETLSVCRPLLSLSHHHRHTPFRRLACLSPHRPAPSPSFLVISAGWKDGRLNEV